MKLPFRAPVSDATGSCFARARDCPVSRPVACTYLKRLTLVIRDGRLVRVFYPVHPPIRTRREVLELASRSEI